MGQYFTNDEKVASHERDVSFDIDGKHITLTTDNGVFSKNKIDEGSFAFLKVIVPLRLSGNILDLGCGYGTIGLTVALTSVSARVELADVNLRALALCRRNAESLRVQDRVTVLQSDVYSNINEEKFDSILINPPIRAGKQVTYSMYEGAFERLNVGGSLYIVIRKAQGAPSASKYIESLFGNIKLLDRSKGYYIYQATRTN